MAAVVGLQFGQARFDLGESVFEFVDAIVVVDLVALAEDVADVLGDGLLGVVGFLDELVVEAVGEADAPVGHARRRGACYVKCYDGRRSVLRGVLQRCATWRVT